MPVVTPEEMETEAQAVAEGVAQIILAGMDPEANLAEKIAAITQMGYSLFGDVGAGIDNDANRARFGLEVAAKASDVLVSELLPLTEPDDDPQPE